MSSRMSLAIGSSASKNSASWSVSMVKSGRYGVSRIGECHSTWRSTTTKRLDSAVASRCRCTRENIRCEVEEPMSMPTVVSSTLSAAQIATS